MSEYSLEKQIKLLGKIKKMPETDYRNYIPKKYKSAFFMPSWKRQILYFLFITSGLFSSYYVLYLTKISKLEDYSAFFVILAVYTISYFLLRKWFDQSREKDKFYANRKKILRTAKRTARMRIRLLCREKGVDLCLIHKEARKFRQLQRSLYGGSKFLLDPYDI